MTTQPSDWAVRTAFLELTEAPAYEVLNTHFREEVLIRARELDASGDAPRAAEAGDLSKVKALPAAWRMRAERKRIMCLASEAQIDEAHAYELEAAMGAVGAGD